MSQQGEEMGATWKYGDAREYVRRVNEGMPPVIVSCATTGEYRKRDHPNVPVTAEEQAEAAAVLAQAGARIIHIHGREADDPDKSSNDPRRYFEINELIREKAPNVLIDNTQTIAELAIEPNEILGKVHYYKSAPLAARPDVMALNPGPMTFRGAAEWPSGVFITTFDESERTANALRDAGIKPQVFLYHPGHLDILEYLIAHDALDRPYFVQMVFGQQSGINAGPDSVLYMARNLPDDCVFQTCALGLLEVQVNTLALLLGGHVRTGMEDSLLYQKDQPVSDNLQFVERIVRIANDLGRRVASAAEVRQILGLPVKV
ncbi:MAG: 3-keto-5-aminohexanoate cleavage enzyme [Thermomicrobiales bacterium]|nr:3-keto-5-aminohexanoate cleavage enzyme [Thermomicrobiales bacterium]